MRIPSRSQQQAISHLSGPAMVIAGPGSGKTFTIIERILYLIRNHHIPPENILVITYTKAAASEMKERFEKAYTSPGSSGGLKTQKAAAGAVNFGTFHSICYHILKQSGIVKENSLIKESDKRRLLQTILGTLGLLAGFGQDEITFLVNEISRRKNFSCKQEIPGHQGTEHQRTEHQGTGYQRAKENPQAQEHPKKSSAAFSGEELTAVCREYDRHLREQGQIDFDDMILLCLQLFDTDERSLARYRSLFRFILVDEFQDINPPQYEILKRLAHPLDNLFVVGDDDQAIYGFRGATPGIMQQFAADFGSPEQIMLTENYRCASNIVTLAGEMIRHNKERFFKEFYPQNPPGRLSFQCFDSRREEETAMIRALSGLTGDELMDTAIILRTNREAVLYAGALGEAGIAVKGSRLKEDIYHGFIMQDVLAFLAYLYEGHHRRDFICFMNKPGRFLTRMALPEEKVRIKTLEQYYAKNPDMLSMLRKLFRQLQIAEGLSPYLAVSFFRKTLGYNEYLGSRSGGERDHQRLLSLADRVQQCFEGYQPGGRSLKEYIAQKASGEAGAEGPGTVEEAGVRILTMHGSKGLEFGRVFLPDLNEGVIPGKDSLTPKDIEEERRLLYVAVTRAKKELYLYCTKERGRKPSRYLEGLAISERPEKSRSRIYSSSSTSSSNSALSRNSSKASETISYSSSSSI